MADVFIDDILDNLDDLEISSVNEAALPEVASEGVKSPAFTSLVAELANELAVLYELNGRVSTNTGDSDTNTFLFEVGNLLSEMNCPHSFLTGADMVLQRKDQCLTLLLYLTSELQAAKMQFFHHPIVPAEREAGSEVFKQLKNICLALRMAKPPDDITVQSFMSGVEKKVQDATCQCTKEHLSRPAIKQTHGPAYWEKLDFMNETLRKEYEMRRSMLLRRLDVTIASFNWSERAKCNVDGVAQAYQERKRLLQRESSISVAHLLAARDDLSLISKTASGKTRQLCSVNKLLMGHVPDRGGRTKEINAPLPEMPSWQKRREGGGGRGDHRPSRGRGGQGSRGNRRGGGNWGRGRGNVYQSGGHFEQAFGRGGR